MNHFFSVDYRMRRGDIHVDLQGYFDGSAAKQLISFLSFFYKGKGRVFVNTVKLNTLTESGTDYFKKHFFSTPLAAHDLYFKGEQGMGMMPQGSRIILMKKRAEAVVKKHQCSGNCVSCKCGDKKEHAKKPSIAQVLSKSHEAHNKHAQVSKPVRTVVMRGMSNVAYFHHHADHHDGEFMHTHLPHIKITQEKMSVQGKTISYAFSK